VLFGNDMLQLECEESEVLGIKAIFVGAQKVWDGRRYAWKPALPGVSSPIPDLLRAYDNSLARRRSGVRGTAITGGGDAVRYL